MAQILYTPFPQDTPQLRAPDDLQQFSTSPAQFGGLAAQAEQRGGNDVQQAGGDALNIAMMRQQRYNQVSAQDALNQYMSDTRDLTFGDPNDPNKKGIYSLTGVDAMKAAQPTLQKLDEIREQLKGGLSTTASQLLFDQDSRRFQFSIGQEIGRHVDSQTQTYFHDQANATMKKGVEQAGLNYDNPDARQRGIDMARQGAVQVLQLRGEAGDPVQVDSALRSAEGMAVVETARNWAQRDPAAAVDWVKNGTIPGRPVPGPNGQLIRGPALPTISVLDGVDKANLVNELQVKADNQIVASSILAATSPGGGIHAAIRGQEGPGTSIQGAVAGVMPQTFAQYAHPGESISNPADVANVRDRVIDALSARPDVNGDPARIAVGFFSGPGNIAPPGSPTPWIKDLSDRNGKTTSSYVSDVQQRILAPGQTSQSRDSAIPPKYFDQMQTISRAYDIARTLPPQQALRVINGVFEQVQHQNAFDEKVDADAQKNLTRTQTDNAANLFGAAIQGTMLPNVDLGQMVQRQQISLTQFNALSAVREKSNEGRDDPGTVMALWNGIGDRKITPDDVYAAVENGIRSPNGIGVKSSTGYEMIKSINAQQKTQQDQVERGDYDTLKTVLGGHAIESGLMDIFGEKKIAAAQLWSQAQQEWNQRVTQRGEKPDDVLADMIPRYQKSVPNLPSEFPNPRLGAVSDMNSVKEVGARTIAAYQAGQMDQSTYNAEATLLKKYATAYQMQADAAAAAKAATAHKGAAARQPVPSDNQ